MPTLLSLRTDTSGGVVARVQYPAEPPMTVTFRQEGTMVGRPRITLTVSGSGLHSEVTPEVVARCGSALSWDWVRRFYGSTTRIFVVLRVNGDRADTWAVEVNEDLMIKSGEDAAVKAGINDAIELAIPDEGSSLEYTMIAASDAGAARIRPDYATKWWAVPEVQVSALLTARYPEIAQEPATCQPCADTRRAGYSWHGVCQCGRQPTADRDCERVRA